MNRGRHPVFHHDIRWPNIVQIHEPLKWILIDWDDACGIPSQAAYHLSDANHAPEVFQDGHRADVDMWGVGNLICEASQFLLNISPDVTAAGEWMKITPRPTAKVALEKIQEIQASLVGNSK